MDNTFTKPSDTLQQGMNLRFLAELFLSLQPICSEVTAGTLDTLSNGSLKLVLELRPKQSCTPSETNRPSSTLSTKQANNLVQGLSTQLALCKVLGPLRNLLSLYRSRHESGAHSPNFPLDPSFVHYLDSVMQAVEFLGFGSSAVNQEWENLRSQFRLLYQWHKR